MLTDLSFHPKNNGAVKSDGRSELLEQRIMQGRAGALLQTEARNCHEATVLLSRHHRYTSNVDMSFQQSISKPKEKANAGPLPNRPDPETSEGVGSKNLSLQLMPHGGVVEDGGNFDLHVGGSDSMCPS